MPLVRPVWVHVIAVPLVSAVPLLQFAGKPPVLKTSLYGVDAERPLPTSDPAVQVKTTRPLPAVADNVPSLGRALSMRTKAAFVVSTLPT